jgi:MerR family transcriptional regulator/heat shock protein HspR
VNTRRQTRSSRTVTTRVTTVRTEIDRDRGVFMISVAAELADMHPQTLRMYEARGLITPKRSPKNTRLYSQEDVERLRRIQAMTAEQGLNLAGVETVLELEDKLDALRGELRTMQERAAEMERQMATEIERAKSQLRAEIVPYRAYESEAIAQPAEDDESIRAVPIPVERRKTSNS